MGDAYTEAHWVRMIRQGIAPNGSPLVVMPFWEYYYLSDEDLGTWISFLKQIPTVAWGMLELQFGPAGRAIMGTGQGNSQLPAARIDHDAPRGAGARIHCRVRRVSFPLLRGIS